MSDLQGVLEQLAPCMDAPALWLGLSGGLDSMVLLHAVTELRRHSPLPPLKAIHVHHGIHPDADRWVEHCQRECAARQVDLVVHRVTLPSGGNVEELARDARYAVFEQQLGAGDWLLLAHHADDQLETLLFRLMRGTGVRGLAGMPRSRALGQGRLLRPLLDWTRAQLADWAAAQGLAWIEDPANADPRYARTALRHQLLPYLRQHWPMLPNNLLRLAGHAGEANQLLDERAAEDLQALGEPPADPWLACWPSLDMQALGGLSPARQKNLLRYWLHQQGLRLPDQRRLHTLLEQLAAADDSQPRVRIHQGLVHRSSGRLWLLPEQGVPAGQDQSWEAGSSVKLTAGNGWLRCSAGGPLALRAGQWRIGYRQGGEEIRLPGRPTQSLKKLFQNAGIPAWLRPAVPLLYCDERLVSVAGRWHAESALADAGETGFGVIWEPIPD